MSSQQAQREVVFLERFADLTDRESPRGINNTDNAEAGQPDRRGVSWPRISSGTRQLGRLRCEPSAVRSFTISARRCSVKSTTLTSRALVQTALVLVALVSPAPGHYLTGSEDVNGNRSTPAYTHDGNNYGPFAWNYSMLEYWNNG